jgi:hypothetical protein
MQVHNLLNWLYDELEAVMRKETLDFVQLNYSLDDRAAERCQQFPSSDGDCHAPLPCEGA